MKPIKPTTELHEPRRDRTVSQYHQPAWGDVRKEAAHIFGVFLLMATRRNGSWTRSEKYVMTELKRHSRNADKMLGLLVKIQVDIGQLKVKAGVWGAIAGIIPSITVLILWIANKG